MQLKEGFCTHHSLTHEIYIYIFFIILKDKACEDLEDGRHQESEECDDDTVSDTEEKRLREEAIYEKEMVHL
jgi:hypothetical protein